jgi:hypothetical protein
MTRLSIRKIAAAIFLAAFFTGSARAVRVSRPAVIVHRVYTHIDGLCDTFRCMKTTVELSDGLLREAKRVALKNRTTVKALIEQGLRTVLAERKRGTGFTLRNAGFRGDGLVSGRSLRDWASIRDLIYSERGA